jgi:predicted helicase
MWGEWPGKLKAGLKGDKGVNLVAETRDKQLVAIQVRFRREQNDPVTAPEVQKLVGSYRKHIAPMCLNEYLVSLGFLFFEPMSLGQR